MTNPTDLRTQLKSRISAALGMSALALVLGLAACNQPAPSGGGEAAPAAEEPAAPAPEGGAEGGEMAPAPEGGEMAPAPEGGAPAGETPPQ